MLGIYRDDGVFYLLFAYAKFKEARGATNTTGSSGVARDETGCCPHVDVRKVKLGLGGLSHVVCTEHEIGPVAEGASPALMPTFLKFAILAT